MLTTRRTPSIAGRHDRHTSAVVTCLPRFRTWTAATSKTSAKMTNMCLAMIGLEDKVMLLVGAQQGLLLNDLTVLWCRRLIRTCSREGIVFLAIIDLPN